MTPNVAAFSTWTAVALLAAAAAAACVPWKNGRLASPVLFLCAVAAALAAWQWPALLVAQQLNPDESSFIAQAHAASVHGLPWRDFDGTTSGPLNTYALLVLHWIGAPFAFATARWCGFALRLGSLAAVYAAVRIRWGDEAARMPVLACLVFFALGASDTDYVHYSSETLPAFLVALLGVCAAAVERRVPGRTVATACAGLLAGALPFSKLQVLPVDCALGGMVFALLAARRELRLLALFAACAFVVPALVLVPVWNAGSWRDFVISYIRQPLVYADAGVLRPAFPHEPLRMLGNAPFALFAAAGALFVLIGIAAWRGRRLRPSDGAWIGAAAVVVAAAGYAIERAHHPLGHYLLLMIVPAAWLVGGVLGPSYRPPSPRVRLAVASAAAVFVIVCGDVATIRVNPFLAASLGTTTELAWYQDAVLRLSVRAPAERDLLHTVPADASMAVWGWEPDVYVVSGAVMGTRDSQTQFAMWRGPYREYYRERFLRDVRRRRPAFFLDAVRAKRYPFMTLTSPADRHESDARLTAYVDRNYRFVAAANGLRLYVRKDAAL